MTYILLFTIILFIDKFVCERITYISLERPQFTYINEKYLSFANVSARKYSRKSMMHYFSMTLETLTGIGNNVTIDVYFYELLTNQYKPTFVEMHFRVCDLIQKDFFFGPALRASIGTNCPLPKGVYHLVNGTIPITAIPRTFPFTKGRIYANASLSSKNEMIYTGHVDMELKQITVKSNRSPRTV